MASIRRSSMASSIVDLAAERTHDEGAGVGDIMLANEVEYKLEDLDLDKWFNCADDPLADQEMPGDYNLDGLEDTLVSGMMDEASETNTTLNESVDSSCKANSGIRDGSIIKATEESCASRTPHHFVGIKNQGNSGKFAFVDLMAEEYARMQKKLAESMKRSELTRSILALRTPHHFVGIKNQGNSGKFAFVDLMAEEYARMQKKLAESMKRSELTQSILAQQQH